MTTAGRGAPAAITQTRRPGYTPLRTAFASRLRNAGNSDGAPARNHSASTASAIAQPPEDVGHGARDLDWLGAPLDASEPADPADLDGPGEGPEVLLDEEPL